MRRTQLLCFVMAMLLLPSLALADSIVPPNVNVTIDPGVTYRLTKTVTVDGRTVNDLNPIDIVFLFDTSESMRSNYTDVRWSSGTVPQAIIDAANAVGGNVHMAVASHEDFATVPWGNPGDVPYRRNIDLTGTDADVKNAMTSMTFGSGNDNPESSLHALDQLNVHPTDSISWRPNSTRIVMWFGDQPGHLGGELATGGGSYPGSVSNKADLIADYLGANIVVEAFDFGMLDGKLLQNLDGAELDDEQATAITQGTGGDYFTSWWVNNNDKVTNLDTTVASALEAAMFLYTVGLDLSEVPGALNLNVVQDGSGSGDRRNGDLDYTWILEFTGNTPGIYSFWIDALVDRVPVARENDRFNIGGQPNPVIPEPSTVALLGLGLLGLGFAARRRKK